MACNAMYFFLLFCFYVVSVSALGPQKQPLNPWFRKKSGNTKNSAPSPDEKAGSIIHNLFYAPIKNHDVEDAKNSKSANPVVSLMNILDEAQSNAKFAVPLALRRGSTTFTNAKPCYWVYNGMESTSAEDADDFRQDEEASQEDFLLPDVLKEKREVVFRDKKGEISNVLSIKCHKDNDDFRNLIASNAEIPKNSLRFNIKTTVGRVELLVNQAHVYLVADAYDIFPIFLERNKAQKLLFDQNLIITTKETRELRPSILFMIFSLAKATPGATTTAETVERSRNSSSKKINDHTLIGCGVPCAKNYVVYNAVHNAIKATGGNVVVFRRKPTAIQRLKDRILAFCNRRKLGLK